MAAPDIKAIIFDCFGVLYTDTKVSLLEKVAPERRRELDDLFTSNNYGYFDRTSFVKQVADITGLTIAEVELYIAKEHHLNTELVSFIQTELRPGYKIGLLSNIGREWIDSFFDAHQLHDLFQAVVLSGEEGVTKPHPAIYELMAARLALKTEQCVMIDDIKANCQGAEMAGMAAVHFTSNDQLLKKLHGLHLFDKNDTSA